MSGIEPIRRGVKLTARRLIDAFKNVSLVPYGGRDVNVTGRGQDVVITKTGRTPGRKVQWFASTVSHERDGANWRWVYTIRERIKATPGYGGWIDRTNGRMGDAYAWAEDINGSSGVLGNGIDLANLPGTFEPQPVPDGSPIIVTEVTLTDALATKEWWFERVTGPDGECQQPIGPSIPEVGA